MILKEQAHFHPLAGIRIQTYEALVNQKNLKHLKQNQSNMLEEIVKDPIVITAGIITASALIPNIFSATLDTISFFGSPKLENEEHANTYFQELLEKYEIDSKEIELRITYDGRNYLAAVEDKAIVFINLKNKPTENHIKHELLHYKNSDISLEREPTLKDKLLVFPRYHFIKEPRVALQIIRENYKKSKN